ncbi:MAG TPA: hypothetical protein VFE24_01465 [Pirellulales bacterium]|jgi:GNAT superfamily N-acetyltransferase|nr:hypothetical protein [Pirellulales bacterium]
MSDARDKSTAPAPVTTYYLEMREPTALRPRRSERADLQLEPVEPPDPDLNRAFYCAVGRDWQWIDRLPWSLVQWSAYVLRPVLHTRLFRVQGEPAGYAELEVGPAGDVEIVYFGMLPRFVGAGCGGYFLSETVRAAWQLTTKRVWVHTCSLDHPAALQNYLARGFSQYRVEHKPDSATNARTAAE